MKPALVALVLACGAALVAAACASSARAPSPTETAAPPGTTGTPAGGPTGVAAVDAAIKLLLAKDASGLLGIAEFRPVPCQANEPSLSTSVNPQCASGIPPGTPIDAFPLGNCEGHYVTSPADLQSAFSGILSGSGSHTVYAVAKGDVIDSQTGRPANPEVAFTIVLTEGTPASSDAPASLWKLTADGKLAQVAAMCGQTGALLASTFFGSTPLFLYGPVAPAANATPTP